MLVLVFSCAVRVGGIAGGFTFEEEHLSEAFVRVYFRWYWCGVGDFEHGASFPSRFEWCDVDDDAAAGVGGFSKAYCHDVMRNAEVFDADGEGEAVGGYETGFAFDFYQIASVEALGVDDGAVDIGEDAVLARDADVVTVGREAV